MLHTKNECAEIPSKSKIANKSLASCDSGIPIDEKTIIIFVIAETIKL